MAIPVLLVVDDNPDGLKALDGVLRHRYGRDYLIISEQARSEPPPVSRTD